MPVFERQSELPEVAVAQDYELQPSAVDLAAVSGQRSKAGLTSSFA